MALPSTEREAVARACGGNPLFAEELASFLAERSDVGAIPPTLGALLAARLDRLPQSERAAAERGAVEGEIFHRGAVTALSIEPEQLAVPGALDGLAGRDLVRPAQARFVDEAAFRFKHALVRDAAYEGTAKRLRAELHERFADWLEEKVGERLAEVEEILGYHLEQAYRYRTELTLVDEEASSLARRAAARLASAGGRALLRSELPAAVSLLARAAELLPVDAPERFPVLFDLAEALMAVSELGRARATAEDAVRTARASRDERAELRASIALSRIRLATDPDADTADVRTVVERSIAALEELADDRGLADAFYLLGVLEDHEGRGAASRG